jgi:hypothetical protein
VDLVGERVTDPPAVDAEPGAFGDHLVVGLQNAEPGDAPVEASAA